MAALAPDIRYSLAATGYLRDDGQPAAASVTVTNGGPSRRGSFQPDVVWRHDNLGVYFKHAPNTSREEISVWQQEVWNEGSVPLLWLIGQGQTELYNGFARPQGPDAAGQNRLGIFAHDGPTLASSQYDKDLTDLNATAGRLSMESGGFWREESRVSRTEAVDRRLLRDIMALEASLVEDQLPTDDAQALIGRAIFAKYLVDKNIVTDAMLSTECDRANLPEVLRHPPAAKRLFAWLKTTFNGDMFPTDAHVPAHRHLAYIANFLDGDDPATGQRALFPYRFDIIPIELISAICEQFAHSAVLADRGDPRKHGVYYTPRAAVSLILDQVMAGMKGDETVLDITCGCGIFLVEALRRLVKATAGNAPPTRSMIRDVLYKQIYGVDVSDAAIRVAALSLYLAALELDPRPSNRRGMKFRPIMGRSLLVGDAHNIERTDAGKARLTTAEGRKRFDLIVGNPPFTGAHDRGGDDSDNPQPPYDRSISFAERAMQFAHEKTRFGMILRATPFFSVGAGRQAAQRLVESLSPATIINLSSCSSWLFERANVPVVVLAGRYRPLQDPKHMMLVQAHWSPSGRAGHQFDIAGSDAEKLHVASWKRNPDLFKAAFFGSYGDLLLLDKLRDSHRTLASQLRSMGARFSQGLKLGMAGRRPSEATHLHGLPYWRKSGDIEPFRLNTEVERFTHGFAERPRKRDVYRAPLLVVREFIHPMDGTPRALAAVSERDGVFSNAYYGASFAMTQVDAAHMLAGILSSALGTWYFIMAGSTFGLGPRRLLQEDLVTMPVPSILDAVPTATSRQVLTLAKEFAQQPPDASGWERLDEAVFDLYELNEEERLVARDGHVRASWQWQHGWEKSAQPPTHGDLGSFAAAFAGTVNTWLEASGRRMRGLIYDLPALAPLRVVRFIIEPGPSLSTVEVIEWKRSLPSLLEDLAARSNVPVVDLLSKSKVLRVTTQKEVVVVKPAARRHWMASLAIAEARQTLERNMRVQAE